MDRATRLKLVHLKRLEDVGHDCCISAIASVRGRGAPSCLVM
jgi:hypothetical protein